MKSKVLLIVIAAATLGLTGCANKDIYSGDVYGGSSAKSARQVTYGQVVSVRPVKIQAGEGGGIIGAAGGGALGGIAGNTVGGGTGRKLAGVAGAIAGAVAGSKAEEKANQTKAVEIEVKTDDGKGLVVVQKADRQWQPGERVRLIGSGNNMSVAPAQ